MTPANGIYRLRSQLELLWISCGTADGLIGVNRTFKKWLRSKSVWFYEEEAEGVGHVWPIWRQDFANFAQRAFKPKRNLKGCVVGA